jgi:hypothetical protein
VKTGPLRQTLFEAQYPRYCGTAGEVGATTTTTTGLMLARSWPNFHKTSLSLSCPDFRAMGRAYTVIPTNRSVEQNTLLLWRHASIAMSRRHLPEGYKFKRDYGLDKESSAIDLQAAHTSRMAGSCYARDVREAHGHVASIRAEYRQLSRSWHTCMGFGVPLPPRDELKEPTIKPTITVSAQGPTHSTYNGHKRTREELEKELNSWM